MSLKGIDISNWQANLNVANVAGDFAIMKATQGVTYVNPSCDRHYQEALSSGKRVGVYDFAENRNNSAANEAAYFVNNIKGYVKKAILVLDYESASDKNGRVINDPGDVAWAKAWLDEVFRLTGVRPLIYMSESVVNSHDWSSVVAGNYGLWVAKYRDNVTDYNYNMALAGDAPSVKWWKGYAIWQWTSSGRLDGYGDLLDCNEFYGDASAWDKYAGGSPAPAPTPNPTPTPAPTPAPSTSVYVVKPGDTLSGIAAKYGTTAANLAAINGIKDPNLIYPGQQIKVTGAAPSSNIYTVKSGDNLSSIAAAHGTTVANLVSLNGIANPNLIYPGEQLRLS